MRDSLTPEEKAFIEHLDAVCEDMAEDCGKNIGTAGNRSSLTATA